MKYEETTKCTLAEAQLSRCWDIYEGNVKRLEEDTIRGIVGRAVYYYGSISDGGLWKLRDMLTKIDRRVEIEAECGEPPDCPKGPMQISGEIVNLDQAVSRWGSRKVMTVKDDAGFQVYGTLPRAFDDVNCGDRVEFYATIKRSNRDAKFGFFSKPTKTNILTKQAKEEVAGR